MENKLISLNIRDIKNVYDFKIYSEVTGCITFIYAELLYKGCSGSFTRKEMRGIIKSHFEEKGFFIYEDEDKHSLYVSIFQLSPYKRLEEKDLLYVLFRRFNKLRIFEKNVFRIIKEFLT